MSAAANRLPAEEIRLASRPLGDGRFRTDLSIPGMHCGGCITRGETALSALEGVESALRVPTLQPHEPEVEQRPVP